MIPDKRTRELAEALHPWPMSNEDAWRIIRTHLDRVVRDTFKWARDIAAAGRIESPDVIDELDALIEEYADETQERITGDDRSGPGLEVDATGETALYQPGPSEPGDSDDGTS